MQAFLVGHCIERLTFLYSLCSQERIVTHRNCAVPQVQVCVLCFANADLIRYMCSGVVDLCIVVSLKYVRCRTTKGGTLRDVICTLPPCEKVGVKLIPHPCIEATNEQRTQSSSSPSIVIKTQNLLIFLAFFFFYSFSLFWVFHPSGFR